MADEIVLTDANGYRDRFVCFTKLTNPDRLLISVETDLGSVVHRIIPREQVVTMREWLNTPTESEVDPEAVALTERHFFESE